MANDPGTWNVAVGGAGTTLFETGATVFTGAKAQEIRGDAGGTLTKISQTFGADTPALYKPRKNYLVACRLEKSAGLVAGTIRFSVQDAANAVQDSSNLDVGFAAISTGSFGLHSLIWHSGRDVPTTAKFAIELTVALTDGESVYIDELVMVEMDQVGSNGNDLFITGLRGDTDFVIEDGFTSQVTNNGEGQFAEAIDRWFNVHRIGWEYQVPSESDGSETIPDTYVS